MVRDKDGPTPLIYHEPHWNKFYQYIIYIISFMDSSSNVIVQTAPLWVKILKLNPSHTLPWMSDTSTIIGWGRQQQQCLVKNALDFLFFYWTMVR